MDPMEATKRGLPWCAICERLDGPFFYDHGARLVCERCVKEKKLKVHEHEPAIQAPPPTPPKEQPEEKR